MASNPENVRLTVLMKLQEALDKEAILKEQMLALMHHFADRFMDRRVEINNLIVLHNHPLIDYGVRDELLRSMEEKRQLITNYRDMQKHYWLTPVLKPCMSLCVVVFMFSYRLNKECEKMGIGLPGLALAQQLYVSLKAHGDGDLGTQALVLALEKMNNTSLESSREICSLMVLLDLWFSLVSSCWNVRKLVKLEVLNVYDFV
nr:probable 3-hydroxyisobutyrate dehydrogenase-like 1, mitochondrial [Tanacetum cinerariifolium]